VLRGIEWKGSSQLFKGLHKDDDAVVATMADGRLVVATVDVFTPVVDDPYLYGQIAAANSLSDVYAMGGVPRLALSILAYPPDRFPPEIPKAIIQGAVDKAWEGGAVVGGGHTVKTSEVLFGLAVMGEFPDGKVLEKGGAQEGDLLVLTKPLGIGILTTAIKRQILDAEMTERVSTEMATLNALAGRMATESNVNACTDVTGFGLLGHLSEMVAASNLGVTVDAASVPLLPQARKLAEQGVIPGGSKANLKFISPVTDFDSTVDETARFLLADAQTSGGLMVALPAHELNDFGARCNDAGQFFAVIGEFGGALPRIKVC
jgi:selenide, water dikinase